MPARLVASLLAALVLGALCALGASARAPRSSGGASPGGGTTSTSTSTTPTTPTTTSPAPAPAGGRNPFGGRAMWIWVLGSSDGGDLPTIIQRAHDEGVSTLLIKSSDGSNFWSQFNPTLVQQLHSAHLHVCAWQYVYGTYPAVEAQMGAQAVADGADCLVIDAEVEYEGKYAQAQTYMSDLRQAVGSRYPLVLAGFPYVDYHPSFPYSVFLGPGGAQWNDPQMYWKDIGVSVDTVYTHTFVFNRPYNRPILPLGQLYEDPSPSQIYRFRQDSRGYGAAGVSWWDYQEATTRGWSAIAKPVGMPSSLKASPYLATLGSGMHGDLVVWAQEHLRGAGEPVSINGQFDSRTQAAVQDFQSVHGLGVDGLLGTQTWLALLRYAPVKVVWVTKRGRTTATSAGANRIPVPASAALPDRGDELRGAPGRGRPR